jgi:hypothetical protein
MFSSPSEPAWRLVGAVVKDASGNPLPAFLVQLETELELSVRSYVTGADVRWYQFSEVRILGVENPWRAASVGL